MHNLIGFAVIFLACTVCRAQHGGAKMFRGNSSHFTSVASENIYDTKVWSFFAEAPVRSTPLVNGSSIFFQFFLFK